MISNLDILAGTGPTTIQPRLTKRHFGLGEVYIQNSLENKQNKQTKIKNIVCDFQIQMHTPLIMYV